MKLEGLHPKIQQLKGEEKTKRSELSRNKGTKKRISARSRERERDGVRKAVENRFDNREKQREHAGG